MKTHSFDSEVWYLVKADEVVPTRGAVVGDLVRQIASSFEFLGVPQSLPGPNEGYIYREGRMNHDRRAIAIKQLTVFSDGLHIHVNSDTDDADAVLTAVLKIFSELRYREPISDPTIFHVSRIVFDYDRNIDGIVSKFNRLAGILEKNLEINSPQHLNAIAFSAEGPHFRNHPNLNPTNFRIEQRAGESAASMRYFSLANATTERHLLVLTEIERVFK